VKRLDAVAQAILARLTGGLAIGEKRRFDERGPQASVVVERIDAPAYSVAHFVPGWGDDAVHPEMIFVQPAPGELFYAVYLRHALIDREEVSAVYRVGDRGEVFLRVLNAEQQAKHVVFANAWLRRIRVVHGIALQVRANPGK
jgi:hypothetical protein